MIFRKIASRIKQIKSWRTLVIWCIGVFLGVLIDVFVQETGKALIYVSAEYLGNVFGATCSIAVLGNAVLSLLFGSSEKIIRGVPFQDILHYTKFGSDQKLTIVDTIGSIPLAVYAYAVNLYSTLTMICFLDALLILASSLELWQLLSSKEKEMKVINEVLSEAPP